MFNNRQRWQNEALVEALQSQRKAHNGYVEALEERIRILESQLEAADAEGFMIHTFMTARLDLVKGYVEHCYSLTEEYSDHAKAAVEGFHDDTLDLSKIPCTGKDFKPWE